MTSYYIWILFFAVVAYLIATDNSVAAAFYYVSKLAKSNFEKQKWWLLNNPRNPVVKYLMWRRSMKLAKELMNEYENK
jgi:hypothetical protein